MENIKGLINDPAKLAETMKGAWAKIDSKNEGEVPVDIFKAGLEQVAKEMGLTEMLPSTEKGKAEFKQICDPENKGKVNYGAFTKVVQTGIANMKKEGKL